MSQAKITILGFYNYLKTFDKDLFSELSLPEGIDKDTLTDNILLRGADFEVIYSDPDFMISAIGMWSKKWGRTFTRWIKALSIDYNPLENYGRYESWSDNVDTSNESTGESTDTSQGTGSSQTNVTAFDSNSFQPKDSTSNSNSNTGTTHLKNSGSGKSDSKHEGYVHGNIGVTTSQQMLEAELDIAKWNIYEHITDIFLQEFIIPIY